MKKKPKNVFFLLSFFLFGGRGDLGSKEKKIMEKSKIK